MPEDPEPVDDQQAAEDPDVEEHVDHVATPADVLEEAALAADAPGIGRPDPGDEAPQPRARSIAHLWPGGTKEQNCPGAGWGLP